MAFRKRNIPLGRSPQSSPGAPTDVVVDTATPGVRPSPVTSQPVTSTGTASLDGLLGGHNGLILGSSLLIEEHGTTDYAGALLRFFAAEGICQGHAIHVVGVGKEWVRDLPGPVEEKLRKSEGEVNSVDSERMKIAWRYEKQGPVGERVLPNRGLPISTTNSSLNDTPFCHQFDLTKRIVLPSDARVFHIPIPHDSTKLGDAIIKPLSNSLQTTPTTTIHRLIIPSILNPALYPPSASFPNHFLAFFHSLRGVLRRYSARLIAMISLPLDVYPRASGLIRWAEILSDGVLELTPFPHQMDASLPPTSSAHGDVQGDEDRRPPQGMLRIHKLPLNTQRGEGGAGVGNAGLGADLAFTLGRKRLVVKPYALPPVEGDQEAQTAVESASGDNREAKLQSLRAKDMEF